MTQIHRSSRKETILGDEELARISPKSIARILDRHVYGQKAAKKAAAMVLWKHLHDIRSTVLFVGPSGCGKTEIWRSLKQYYSRIVISDISTLTNEGWSGNKKYYSVLREIFQEHPYEKDPWIIVYDEFDKMIAPKYTRRENVALSLQSEMLQMVEGGEINIAGRDATPMMIDTSRYTFVFIGAFESAYSAKEAASEYGFASKDLEKGQDIPVMSMDDIRNYGLRTELAGRIEKLVQMDDLTESDLYQIAVSEKIGPGRQLSKAYHHPVKISSETARQIAKEAVRTRLGARYLYSKSSDLMDDIVYEQGLTDKIIL